MQSGTLTLVISEISDLRRLMEFSPADAYRAIDLCNEIADEIASREDGEVFQRLDDKGSLIAAFPAAGKAIEMVSELHRTLLEEVSLPTKNACRSAVVTGDLRILEATCEGAALQTLYSMKELARPGQILVSEATHAIVRQSLSEGHAFLNLGLNHLDDQQRAQILYQLLHPDLPDNFQRLPSVLAAASNLPFGVTTFVGRAKECADIRGLFFLSRVVVLTGISGIGKSRLAIRVAYEMLEDHYHGAAYADLAAMESADDAVRAIAGAIGVAEAPGQCLDQSVVEYCKGRELMIVLDNADRAGDKLGALMEKVLDACPQVQVMVTCRHALNLMGATLYPVQPLALPDLVGADDLKELEQVESVSLFLKRAAGALGSFELTKGNAAHVAEICRRMEGIPLAIELAAWAMKSDDVLAVLSSLDNDANKKRHSSGLEKTLQSAVQRSFDALDAKEQLLLKRLSIFAGEFQRDIALRICAFGALADEQAARAMDSLIGQSLVARRDEGEPEQLQLLSAIKEFCARLLRKEGEEEEMAARHCATYAAHADEIYYGLYGAQQAALLAEIECAYRDYLSAVNWAINSKRYDQAAPIVLTLYMFWYCRSRYAEGLEVTERALEDPAGICGLLRGRIEVVAGTMAHNLGDHNCALRHYEHAYATAVEHNNEALKRAALGSLSQNYVLMGEFDRAVVAAEQSAELADKHGDPQIVSDTYNNLAMTYMEKGNYQQTKECLCKCLALNMIHERPYYLSANYFLLGRTARLQNDPELAEANLESALQHYSDSGDKTGTAASLRELAFIKVDRGIFHSAATLFGAEHELRRTISASIPISRRAEAEAYLNQCKSALGSRFQYEFQRGAALTLRQIRDFILYHL